MMGVLVICRGVPGDLVHAVSYNLTGHMVSYNLPCG